ncbi:MAG: patatin-like phospholipase family protein [Planctomycetia bacterium]|nr:patatin-like phospholipase family protein [Planctomycetia bacterium]
MPTGSPGRRNVQTAQVLALAVPVVLAVLVGCSGPKCHHAPEPLVDRVWINRGPVDDYHDADTVAVSGLASALQGAEPARSSGQPLNILCVSGGGKYAAFTAGALCGWTASGTRPVFDVATGVSSGATVAILAFLGPKYDDLLAATFTNLRRRDLFTWQPVRGIITGSGLMSSRPLVKMLERQVNDELLADLCAAHMEGRRLFIATANILTRRVVVWDVGAIACSGRPDAAELVRKVILASCSIPGVVPPVEFDVMVNGVRYTELHADAGNLTQAFVRTAGPIPAGSGIWILSAGKSHPNYLAKRPRILETMTAAVSATLYALFRADTMKLYTLCRVTRSRFRLLALPENFAGHSSSMAFIPAEARRMFWLGYQMAIGGTWQTQPPDTTPGEVPPPRAGLEFVTPE